MTTQISLCDVTTSYGDHLLLDGVCLSVRPGERVGIVGEDGAGKSTLLRIVAGAERPDEGQVVLRADGGIGYLGQTPDLPPDGTVQDMIDAALADLRDMERRLRSLERGLDRAPPGGLEEYGDLRTLFELRGGYEAGTRVDRALHALGLAQLDHDRLLGSLSGGEQARLGIACLIASAPEVMLLDEPTNHLDSTALEWLEGALLAHRGTVLAVWHDRLFLRRIATALVEVDADRRTLVRHGGGYGTFLAAKDATRRRREQEHARWCAQIARLTDFAGGAARNVAQGRAMKDGNKMAYDRAKGRVQASVAGRVRNARERLRRLRENPVPDIHGDLATGNDLR
ncbi:ATP-binding cassette domain-containing protein [Streptomyces platensis]|uniref:ATP-binding cassette domain-containing protein n=1 Tax=Streptomyces platensis TaxID=58346 RepID=UPI003C2FEF0E